MPLRTEKDAGAEVWKRNEIHWENSMHYLYIQRELINRYKPFGYTVNH